MADLKKGDLVYYWDDDERPEKPYVGYFEEKLPNGAVKVVDGEGNVPLPWKHAEPVLPPERWTDDDGNEIRPGDTVEVWDDADDHKYKRTFIRKDEYGYVAISDGPHLPLYWKHAKKIPAIPKGTLVLVWNDEDDPDKFTRLAFYDDLSEDGTHGVRKDDGTPYLVDNVRPVTPEDLEKWRNEDG